MIEKNKPTYIDLHMHSYYSDGISTPQEIVKAAKLKGLDMIALTDHDICTGYPEACNEARRWGLKVLPSAEVTHRKYHILALNFNTQNKAFQWFLAKSREIQLDVSRKRIERIKEKGMPITIEKVKQYFPESRIGKYNILMTMMLDYECRLWAQDNLKETHANALMDHYLRGKGIAAELPDRESFETKEIIDAIHGAGGLAILAHPAKDVDTLEELDTLVEQGLDGFEIQPHFWGESKGKVNYGTIANYASANRLLLTYGSDFHGPNFNRPILGRKENILSPELRKALQRRIEVCTP